jgi:hypothetical protein
MTTREKLAAGLSIFALAVGIGTITASVDRPGGGFATSAQAAETGKGWQGWHSGSRHSWRTARRDRHGGGWCAGETRDFSVFAEFAARELDLDRDQRTAFDALIGQIEAKMDAAQSLCDNREKLESGPIHVRIETASVQLTAMAAMLSDLAGSAEAFHTALDDEQKAKLDGFIRHRR